MKVSEPVGNFYAGLTVEFLYIQSTNGCAKKMA
jgi:hypothetical protein